MTKSRFLIFAFMIAGSILFAQSIDAPMISADAAREMLSSGKNALLLDVRTYDEFVSKHIPGATLLPSGEITQDSALRVLGPDLDRIIIVYCASGGRSKSSASLLLSLGYKNVWNMGGISVWPFGTVKGE